MMNKESELLNKYNFQTEVFDSLKKKFIAGKFTEKDNMLKGKIQPPDTETFFDPEKLSKEKKENYRRIGKKTIEANKLGYAIVNGGMATRFEGVVKGIVEVYDGKSFLQVKLEQIKKINRKYGISMNVYIMNSFATEKATIEYLENKDFFGLDGKSVHFFNQFIFPRINPDGTEFKSTGKFLENFYGPGHGDFVYALRIKDALQGEGSLLEEFIRSGGQHIWYSNCDNLGATVDELILGYHVEKGNEMTAEEAEKYPGDKGGAPAIVDGQIQIVEQFKFPQSFDQDSIQVFNTATYIFLAKSLQKPVDIPWYIVKKKAENKQVVQFERLAGDLSIYLKTGYIKVNRKERFFPVKTPEDLEKQRNILREKFG